MSTQMNSSSICADHTEFKNLPLHAIKNLLSNEWLTDKVVIFMFYKVITNHLNLYDADCRNILRPCSCHSFTGK